MEKSFRQQMVKEFAGGGRHGEGSASLYDEEMGLSPLYEFPLGRCHQVLHTVVAENTRNLLSHSSGLWKSKIKTTAGPCSLWNLEGSPLLPVPASADLLARFGAPLVCSHVRNSSSAPVITRCSPWACLPSHGGLMRTPILSDQEPTLLP